ncbi:MAG: type II secretion system protein GspG [Phycisphaerae bacterium]|nr:MAG: type II secretion system protein GspG [Phycisphaerae bacterium]
MKNRTTRRSGLVRAGFSLLELTLVIAIMGILIAVTTIAIGARGDAAKAKASMASLRTISTSLKEYHLTHNAYPPDLRTLITAKYIEDGGLRDGWNSDFVYDPRGTSPDRPFILASCGPDKVLGNEDDIDVWTMNLKPAN